MKNFYGFLVICPAFGIQSTEMPKPLFTSIHEVMIRFAPEIQSGLKRFLVIEVTTGLQARLSGLLQLKLPVNMFVP